MIKNYFLLLINFDLTCVSVCFCTFFKFCATIYGEIKMCKIRHGAIVDNVVTYVYCMRSLATIGYEMKKP